MAPPSVALMVQRIELNHAQIDTQVKKAPLPQQPATTQALPFRSAPLWANGSPSIPNFSRPRQLKQNPDVLSTNSPSPTAPPTEVTQKASSNVAPKEDDNTQMLEIKRKHPCMTTKIESESSDESDTSQVSDHLVNWPLVDAGLWLSGTTASTLTRQKSLPATCTPERQSPAIAICTPICRSQSMTIEMEPTSPTPAMIEKPRQLVSAVITKPGFPILVSTRRAEQYYRSIGETDSLYDLSDFSPGSTRCNSVESTLADIEEERKEEEDLTTIEADIPRLIQEFDNLIKSTIKIEKTSPTSSPSSSPHDNLDTLHTQTIHQPTPLSPTNLKRSTSPSPPPPPSIKPPPSPAPASLFSYLKPPTPTPFSTAHSIPNNAPYAPNIHFVPGSILEEHKRPTEWGYNHRTSDKPRHHRLPQPTYIRGPIAREYGYCSAGSLLRGQGRKVGRLCKMFKKAVAPMRKGGVGKRDVGLLRKRRKAIEAPQSPLGSFFGHSASRDGVWWRQSVVLAPDAFVGERGKGRRWQDRWERSAGWIGGHGAYQAKVEDDVDDESMMVNTGHQV